MSTNKLPTKIIHVEHVTSQPPPAVPQVRPVTNWKKPHFSPGLLCLDCLNDWFRMKFQIGVNFFFFNSQSKWVWAYGESVQLKRNKSQFLCKMECSVNKCWPLSRRKFAKKEGRQEAEKEKLTGLV